MTDTLSYVLMDYLSSIGVNKVFFVPGGGNMFLVDALGRHPKIDFISTHNEQAAVIAAEAYSRLSEKIGVALVTTGPGATNSITGIAGAWLDSIPVLIISGQVKTKDIKKHYKIRQNGPQEIDIVSMVKDITKYSKTIKNKNILIKEFKKAVSIALSGRPGPVLLDIPLDIQGVQHNFGKFKKNNINNLVSGSNYNYKNNCKYLISHLKKAKKPLFLLGQGVKSSRALNDAKKLITKTNIPCLLTWPMTDFLPAQHKLNMGKPGTVAKRHSNIILQNCDMLITIGARLDKVVTAHNPKNFAKNAKVFCIDIDKYELKKHPKRFNKILIDAKDFIKVLLNQNDLQLCNKNWINECNNIKNFFSKEKFIKKKSFSIYNVIDYLSKVIPSNSIVATGSSGLSIEAFYTHFLNKINQKIFLTTGLGAMGYGFPALVGANKFKKNLFLFESDGSAMMNLQELQTLKTIKSNAKIFLINNNGYASIRNTQRNYFQGRYVGTTCNTGLETPSISKLARSLGIKSYLCKNIKTLKKNIIENINKNELILFEIYVEENEDLLPKCSTHNSKNGGLISAPIEDLSPLLPIEVLKKYSNNKVDNLSNRIRYEI